MLIPSVKKAQRAKVDTNPRESRDNIKDIWEPRNIAIAGELIRKTWTNTLTQMTAEPKVPGKDGKF